MNLYAVILVRGRVNASRRIKDALDSLRLTRVNHCSLVDESGKGMLQVCKDYVTWGAIDAETLAKLIEKRGMLSGDKPVDAEVLKKGGFESTVEFANALLAGKAKLDAFGMKKIFRLHPPRGGYKKVKLAYPRGALGFRKDGINELIRSMM
ncbi:50S ribosomal protein L30 [Candidatus Micrarchaeota archaeon]|nr:MAG: 50S ribosomal protein L30 [Candidatus Micrarchaeota archaeon]